MEKVIRFFKSKSPIAFIVIGVLLIALSYFLEKKMPGIFMGMRLLAFIVILYGLIQFFSKK
ncbi:hypothetical protein FSS13T_20650 [Flavobacterium saliperosum S13]|uniref:PEP-CTERM protein-sorting domain-containing protein n=2 Tax=Flavobacterium saliperosum TaxID=329186 RepID=A0A1G4VRD6_9FLAO|nr:hypothetical protein [Flavobacterium saliperosum]ESU24094.1 hypothetical protein FSS13T_20650 [Flavobacterium saliperosum S13]SCX10770.1 hypothetical protein SAMN02927925_01637 [Flavobacterium saliperosum]